MLKYQSLHKNIANKRGFFFQDVRKLKKVLRKQLTPITWTCLLILSYFVSSAGLNFYQVWLFQTWGFHSSPGSMICDMLAKFLLSALIRWMLIFYNGQKRVEISWRYKVLFISRPGITAGLYMAFSHLGLKLVTMSLYTMARSLTVVFALGMAFMLKLEKKSYALTGNVLMISGGLAMATCEVTQFNANGLFLILLAFFYSAAYSTMAQQMMQDSQFGLCGPIDLIYYMQPWTLFSTSFVAFGGNVMYSNTLNMDWTDTYAIIITVIAIFGRAIIGFCIDLTGLMVISRTSSLSFYVFAISKKLCMLVLAYEWRKNEMSFVNFMGLLTCFAGIICYTTLKLRIIANERNEDTEANSKSVIEEQITFG